MWRAAIRTAYASRKIGSERRAKFNDRSGIISGSGGGSYRSGYDYFPLLTTAKDDMKVFGRELGNTVNRCGC